VSNSGPLLFLLVVAVIFWLLMIRPAQRKARQQQAIQSAVAVGDEVMTTSGIFGEVRALEEETVHLAIAEGVQIRVVRAAIARVVTASAAPDAPDATDDEPAEAVAHHPTDEDNALADPPAAPEEKQ
jgi:preprotein translocase subunit YajC